MVPILSFVSKMHTNDYLLLACFFGSMIAAGEFPRILSRSLACALLTPSAYHMNYTVLPLVNLAVCELQCNIIY